MSTHWGVPRQPRCGALALDLGSTCPSSHTPLRPFSVATCCHAYSVAPTCHIMSCHVMSCHIMSYHVMSCHVMSCHVISCHIMSCPVISCHIMSYIGLAHHDYLKCTKPSAPYQMVQEASTRRRIASMMRTRPTHINLMQSCAFASPRQNRLAEPNP